MARMSPRQFREAQAAAVLDPFPEERLEMMLAQLMALVANALGGKDRIYQPTEFLPDYVTDPVVKDRQRAQEKAARIKTKMAAVRLDRLLKGD